MASKDIRSEPQWVTPSSNQNIPPDYGAIAKIFAYALIVLSWILIICTFPFSMCVCIKVIKGYERVVILRIGRLVFEGVRGPGIVFINPFTDTYQKIDLRVISYAVPAQEILSKDSVTVSLNAVVYFRIYDPIASVNNVADAIYSTKFLAQTTLRNALSMKTLMEILTEREAIAQFGKTILNEGTEHWGVKVERVEINDIRLPQQLTRALAAEGEKKPLVH
uniref:Band 7 domain-containing protein n=1 Tax=Panagrolaimus davidi TaxID=227884 RepID=A0A914PFX4_9BILA